MIGLQGWRERGIPGLLVSVRSAEEAREAIRGGASVIDVKDPARGPLGRATQATWRGVREAVPTDCTVSVALGDLREWDGDVVSCPGIQFCKVGFAQSDGNWRSGWETMRTKVSPGVSWVAVAYADWELASSPSPADVLDAAIEAPECTGVLVDTWDKTQPSPLSVCPEWSEWVDRSHMAGLFVSLAGRLDEVQIRNLMALKPDLFAVRGAACDSGTRTEAVKAKHVARMVQVIGQCRP